MSYVLMYLQSLPLAVPAKRMASLIAAMQVILASELCVSRNFGIFFWVPTGPSFAIFPRLTFRFLTPMFIPHRSSFRSQGLFHIASSSYSTTPTLSTFYLWLLILFGSV